MADIGEARKALVKRILDGPGETSTADRHAAFDNRGTTRAVGALVEKVATQAHKITGEDIHAVEESGLSEDQVFEIVVCAATGQASRQYEAAMAALEAASGKK